MVHQMSTYVYVGWVGGLSMQYLHRHSIILYLEKNPSHLHSLHNLLKEGINKMHAYFLKWKEKDLYQLFWKRKGFIQEEKYFDVQKKRIYSKRKVTKRKEKKSISTHPVLAGKKSKWSQNLIWRSCWFCGVQMTVKFDLEFRSFWAVWDHSKFDLGFKLNFVMSKIDLVIQSFWQHFVPIWAGYPIK